MALEQMNGNKSIYKYDIGFIGAGKVGSALAYWLSRYKIKPKIICDSVKKRANKLAQQIPCGATRDILRVIDSCELVFITVPDDQIPKVVNEISYCDTHSEKMLIHTSGLLSSRILKAAGEEFKTLSLHPFRAVSSDYKDKNPFKFSSWTYEGDDEVLEVVHKFLMEAWGCALLPIDAGNKPEYHLGACFSSNLLIPNLEKSISLLRETGLDKDHIKELMRKLVKEVVENFLDKGKCESLTGPLVRGDTLSVLMHINSLSSEDDEIFYKVLSQKLSQEIETCEGDMDYEVKAILEKMGE